MRIAVNLVKVGMRIGQSQAKWSQAISASRNGYFAKIMTILCLSVVCLWSRSAEALVVAPTLKLSLRVQNGMATVSWPSGVTSGRIQIQSAVSLTGPWQNVGSPTTGTSITIPVSGPIGFFRAVIVENTVAPSGGPWIKRFGGSANDSSTAVTVDSSGNILMAGYFQGSVDFGGGFLTSSGGYDLVLAKYSSTGVHLWSKRFGGTGNELPTSIVLDPSGNILLAGSFYGSANFGGATLTSAGDADAFIAKYSPQGDPIWSQRFGGNYPDVINSIATDSQGNVIATGFLQGIVTVGGITITSFGTGIDIFLAKFSPTGASLWAKNFYNAGTEYGNKVAVDKRINPLTSTPYDNIVLVGYFNGYVNFGDGQMDSGVLNTAGGYIAKFSPAGARLWSRAYGSSNGSTRFWDMALDSNGDIAVCGDFPMQTDLGAGIIAGTSWGVDLFVAKYSGVDGAYRWAVPVLGYQASAARPTAMTVDSQNNVIFTGYYQGTYNFGGQSLTSSAGVSDGFVAKYTSGGSRVWAQGFRSSGAGNGNAVATDSSNYVIVSGSFTGTASNGSVTVTSAGATDVLLMRLAP
jgi:hypothetical protein